MKKPSTIFLQATSLAMLLTGVLHASSLKVYNMYDRPWMCITNPLSDCGHGKEECAVFPYQSIFNSHSVTFHARDQCIEEFYWKGITGPRFKINLNLKRDGYATIELHGNGAYKFKGKMQYAQVIS